MATVLCRLPNHVGDCCMCLPALRLLQASGYTPALVGKRWAEDLVAGMGWRFDPIEGHVSDDLNRIRYLVKNAGAAKGLVFPNSFASALLFKIGRVATAGLKTDCRSFLLDKAIPEPGTMHEVERFFYVAHEAIKAWGGTPAFDKVPSRLGLLSLKRHEAAAKNIFEALGLPENFALLAPVARGKHKGKVKSWSHFNDLVAPLREAGIEPLVFPSVREEELCRAACPDARILPPTSLGNFAAIARRARVVVANDSGVSHIAAAVGATQITLVGVTDPTRTSPWNPDAVVLGSENGWPSVDEVLAAMHKILRA
ncbi:MAG: glycosyltransferase family 9 protein [Duodenibacillus sp.]|nr:glycosyltransferase family 9 protein [Duodenibacillus sp.]